MQATSLEPTGHLQTAALSLLTLAALALLGLVLAYWTWEWLAPAAEPRTQTAPAGEPVEAAYDLFGSAHVDRNGAAPAGVAVQLLGVVAAAGKEPAYALVQLDGRQVLAVRRGEALAPGVRLTGVYADRVILDRGGIEQSLAFPERPSPPPAAVAGNK
jgi:general secretion pathway protein C